MRRGIYQRAQVAGHGILKGEALTAAHNKHDNRKQALDNSRQAGVHANRKRLVESELRAQPEVEGRQKQVNKEKNNRNMETIIIFDLYLFIYLYLFII